jgi:hypothetical protein
MPTEIEDTLTTILVSNVLITAKQLDAEARAKGTKRVGGDYTREAADLLRTERVKVLQALRQR